MPEPGQGRAAGRSPGGDLLPQHPAAGPAGQVQPSAGSLPGLAAVVDALCTPGSGPTGHLLRRPDLVPSPSRQVIGEIIEALRSVLFPGYFGTADLSSDNLRYHVGATLDAAARALREQVNRGLCFTCVGDDPARCAGCAARAEEVTRAFVARLPQLQATLAGDAAAAFEGDPAADSLDEVVFCYPGLQAITSYRIAHELAVLGVPLIPRLICELAHSSTGIDIHPDAELGERLFIDHGTGVVIGATSVIGNRVRIYQGVTLGAKTFPVDEQGRPAKGIPRHPIVEDDVVIYAEATILGRVRIGRGSVIGGNVWLTRDVPPGSRVSQATPRAEAFNQGSGI